MTDYIRNKKATLDFELLERFEAGAELLGSETKSIRGGQGKLTGAYVVIRGGEVYLVGASIPPFQKANAPKGYEDERPRKLLLSKKEIEKLKNPHIRSLISLFPQYLITTNDT